MKKYRVIKFFTDLQDKGHAYNVGDVFPRHGLDVTESRIKQLMSAGNKQHTPLIEEDVPKKSLSEVKEEPLESEAGESIEEKPKAKKRAKKTQEKV